MVGFEYIFKYYANVGTIFELPHKKTKKNVSFVKNLFLWSIVKDRATATKPLFI